MSTRLVHHVVRPQITAYIHRQLRDVHYISRKVMKAEQSERDNNEGCSERSVTKVVGGRMYESRES